MNVTAAVLTQRAEKIGIPFTKNEFTGTLDDPVPELPYMIYLLPHSAAAGADGLNNLVSEDWDLELYTKEDGEDLKTLTERIETEVLADVTYEKFTAYIEDEECYQTAYEVNGMLRKLKGAKKNG